MEEDDQQPAEAGGGRLFPHDPGVQYTQVRSTVTPLLLIVQNEVTHATVLTSVLSPEFRFFQCVCLFGVVNPLKTNPSLFCDWSLGGISAL